MKNGFIVVNWTPALVVSRILRVDGRWIHTPLGIFDEKNGQWLRSGSVKIAFRGTKKACFEFITKAKAKV